MLFNLAVSRGEVGRDEWRPSPPHPSQRHIEGKGFMRTQGCALKKNKLKGAKCSKPVKSRVPRRYALYERSKVFELPVN